MKTKFKSILALAILMMCMSSCVYSLFPIYTKDTLVYLPELEGKWMMGDDPEHYILFERAIDIEETITVTTAEPEPEETEVTKSSDVRFELGDGTFIVVNGDTIREKERIKEFYRKEVDSAMSQIGEAMGEVMEEMGKAFKKISRTPNPKGFINDSQAYNMTVVDGDEILKYQVHLANIGDDIFMDLYATDDAYTDKAFTSMVWFPVHTFMKMELDRDRLTLTQFDLDKLNKLFDSGLIRMSHENVDGTVLITAKSEELQKFLERYARDESVYEEVEVYNRQVQ